MTDREFLFFFCGSLVAVLLFSEAMYFYEIRSARRKLFRIRRRLSKLDASTKWLDRVDDPLTLDETRLAKAEAKRSRKAAQ